MKRKIIPLIIIVLICIISYFLYYNNKTETVLLSGKVFGFDIQSENNNDIYLEDKVVPTSLKKIGTITFVKKDNNSFVALGHSIKEIKNQNEIKGNCYNINLNKIEKSEKNTPGKIIAELKQETKIGKVSYTNSFGIFGTMNETNNLKEIETESRFNIKKGKAEIVIDLNGKGQKRYEIDITEMDYFHKNQNIKFNLRSKELIDLAGGIVQGMSGAPIVQNGKLIGAVNYVDIENPQEAYGVFIDKLL